APRNVTVHDIPGLWGRWDRHRRAEGGGGFRRQDELAGMERDDRTWRGPPETFSGPESRLGLFGAWETIERLGRLRRPGRFRRCRTERGPRRFPQGRLGSVP